jgi:hypothetical protein
MLNQGGDKERSKSVDNAFFLVTSSGCIEWDRRSKLRDRDREFGRSNRDVSEIVSPGVLGKPDIPSDALLPGPQHVRSARNKV